MMWRQCGLVVLVLAVASSSQAFVIVRQPNSCSSAERWRGRPYPSLSSSSPPPPSSSSGLNMVFDQFSSAVSGAIKDLGPKPKMTMESIKDALDQAKTTLLVAGVDEATTTALVDRVQKQNVGKDIMEGASPEQQFVKAIFDELVDVLGGDSSDPTIASVPPAVLQGSIEKPAVVFMVGATDDTDTASTAEQLSLYLKERELDDKAIAALPNAEQVPPDQLPKKERKVLVVGGDDSDAVTDGINKAKEGGYDTVIMTISSRQPDDIKQIQQSSTSPSETLLVVDAAKGEESVSQIAVLEKEMDISGSLLANMDETSYGVALNVAAKSGRPPIKFVAGSGEERADFGPFLPDRMAGRILGLGDISEEDGAKMQQRMAEGVFDFDDFVKQSEMLSKLQGVAGMAKNIPGLGGQLDADKIKQVEGRLEKNKRMIKFMTFEERKDPDLLIKNRKAGPRLQAIAEASETTYEEVLGFLGEFQRLRTMMARMQKQQMNGETPDPSDMSDLDVEEVAVAAGNRATRRAKKKRKKGRGGGGGFG